MQKYECEICEYVYDPEEGDPENGVAPGTPFEICRMAGFVPPVVWIRTRLNLWQSRYEECRKEKWALFGEPDNPNIDY